jgi:hypothetical protein
MPLRKAGMTTNEPVSNIVRRPGSVTLVVVLTIISGILTLLGGLFLLLLGGAATLDRLNVSGGAVLFFGILYLILGIITIIVGIGLRNGSRLARMLVTILMVIDIISAITSLIWFQTSQTVTSSIIAIIVSVIVLALLWNRRASEFFAA